jgi:hypothetical protein
MDGTPEGCQFGKLCTFRHGDETKEQAQKRQQLAYMAKKAAANGGGGGGGPVSPPRVPRVVPAQAPWAPARVTYAQKAQPNPEMPGWMIEGKKLEGEFNMIAEAEAAYKLVVQTAIAKKKAAETAAQKAYKAELEKADEAELEKERSGKKKPHVPVGLTDNIGSFADEAANSDEE